MKNIALFDMDGTLADYNGQMKRDLKKLSSPNEPESFVDFSDQPRWVEARMDCIKNSPDWWLNLPIINSGYQILQAALELDYEVHVLTKGPYRTTSAWTQKVQWCRQHLPKEVKVTITEDKSLVYGRVLVDDYPGYVEKWLEYRPRGLALMPSYDYNAGFNPKNVYKYTQENVDYDGIVHELKKAKR